MRRKLQFSVDDAINQGRGRVIGPRLCYIEVPSKLRGRGCKNEETMGVQKSCLSTAANDTLGSDWVIRQRI
jgi:hypothetical protein